MRKIVDVVARVALCTALVVGAWAVLFPSMGAHAQHYQVVQGDTVLLDAFQAVGEKRSLEHRWSLLDELRFRWMDEDDTVGQDVGDVQLSGPVTLRILVGRSVLDEFTVQGLRMAYSADAKAWVLPEAEAERLGDARERGA